MDSLNIKFTERNKVELIEIKIKKISQLFNSLDPSPFIEKDMDDDAFEYIVSSVKEHHIKTKAKIIIHLPLKEQKRTNETDIRTAIKHFFEYKRKLEERNVKLQIKEGQKSMIVGVVFLASCILTRYWLLGIGDTVFLHIIAEGLVIGGWVAMWKPISNLLYDWWPSNVEKHIYDKISKMEIEFRYT